MFEQLASPALPFDVLVFHAGPHKNLQYVIRSGDEALAVDLKWEPEQIAARAGRRPDQAVYTHAHWDHLGVPEVFDHGIKHARIHAACTSPVVASEVKAGRMDLLREGDTFDVGGVPVRVLHTPGHQPESACFLVGHEEQALFTGDTLFLGRCGRTDFPGGDTDAMHASLQRIATLPPETVVLPGHLYHRSPYRSLGEELEQNPAFTDRDSFEHLAFLSG